MGVGGEQAWLWAHHTEAVGGEQAWLWAHHTEAVGGEQAWLWARQWAVNKLGTSVSISQLAVT